MAARPNARETEADLLRLQKSFMTRTSDKPNITVSKPMSYGIHGDKGAPKTVLSHLDRVEKRVKSLLGEELANQMQSLAVRRDVASLSLFYRYYFDSASVDKRTGDDRAKKRKTGDFESFMDDEDRHITAVMSRILERECDFSKLNEPREGPLHSSGMPKVCELKMDEDNGNATQKPKRSLFAQQMDQLKIGRNRIDSRMEWEPASSEASGTRREFEASSVVTGKGLTDFSSGDEQSRIHRENTDRLSKLSHDELLEMREHLLSTIDPNVAAFLTKRSNITSGTTSAHSSKIARLEDNPNESNVPSSTTNLEDAKLAWIKEVKMDMDKQTQTQARFDFEGNVIPEKEDLSVKVGLHHHGEEPDRAGYTASELFILSRSTDIRQRQMAFRILGRCTAVARGGGHLMSIQTPILPNLLACGYPFLLRWGLDDNFEAVSLAALSAICQLVSHLDYEVVWLDRFFHYNRAWIGTKSMKTSQSVGNPLMNDNSDGDDSEVPIPTDVQVMENDLISGFLQTNILQRLSFMLKKVLSRLQRGMEDNSLIDFLTLLSSISLHSHQSANRVTSHSSLVLPLISFCTDVTEEQMIKDTLPEHVFHAIRLLRILCLQDKTFCRFAATSNEWMEAALLILSKNIKDYRLISEILRLLVVTCSDSHALVKIKLQGFSLVNQFKESCQLAVHHGEDESWVVNAWLTLTEALILKENAVFESWITEMTEIAFDVVRHELNRFSGNPREHSHLNVLTGALKFMQVYQSLLKTSGSQKFFEMQSLFSKFGNEFDQLLVKCMKSLSFDSMLQGLRMNSFITLSESPPIEPLFPDNMVSPLLFVHQRLTDGSVKKVSPLESPKWPVETLKAFIENVILINERHCVDYEGIGEVILTQTDVVHYLIDFLDSPSAVSCLLQSRVVFSEVGLIVSSLNLACCLSKVLTKEPTFPLGIIHSAAIRIFTNLHPTLLEEAKKIMNGVVFHPFFTSRIGKRISCRPDESSIIADMPSNLLNISSTYIQLISASHSDNECPGAHLCSIDWPYQPILQIYYSTENRKSADDDETTLTDAIDNRRQLSHSIKWIYYMETVFPSRLHGRSIHPLRLSVGGKLVRLFCFFMSSSDLFLEPEIARVMESLLQLIISQIKDRLTILEDDCCKAGRQISSSFHDLYLSILRHFFGVSYGSAVFTNFILIPTMSSFSDEYRRVLWSEFTEQLRTITLSVDECLVPIQCLLEDSPSSLEVLRLQTESLFRNTITIQRNSLLYLMAIHALNRALYRHVDMESPVGKFQKLVAKCITTPEYLPMDLCFHIQYYKTYNNKIVFYDKEEFPEIRRSYLQKLVET